MQTPEGQPRIDNDSWRVSGLELLIRCVLFTMSSVKAQFVYSRMVNIAVILVFQEGALRQQSIAASRVTTSTCCVTVAVQATSQIDPLVVCS